MLLDQGSRELRQNFLALTLLFGLLPSMASGSIVFHLVDVTVQNARSIGFEVSVVTSSTNPRSSARIVYPSEVDGIWAAESLQLTYFDADGRKRLVQRIDLNGNDPQPIKFLFDQQDGESKVTAIFTYLCIDENIKCNDWPHIQYYFSSIASFETEK
jgi:hypothetical protein